MEVEAGHGVADAELAVEDAGHELLRALAGEVAREGLLDDGVEAELGEQARLHRRRRQEEQRHVRAEDGARMRLEGQHQRRHAAPVGFLARALEHRLVAAMDAVEIADRDHAAAQFGGQRRIAG